MTRADAGVTEVSHHPRYQGPVIDSHCHFDLTTVRWAEEALRQGGLKSAVHLWDVSWPPLRYAAYSDDWAVAPNLARCHVPDLSAVGAPGFEETRAQQLRADAAAGAVGVKIWKNLGLWINDIQGGRVAVDDPRLAIIWGVAAELGLPVVIHQGDPPSYFQPMTDDNPRIEELRAHPEWWFGGGDYPTLEQIHEELEAVIARHPATVFITAHFGSFMSVADVRRMCATYGNYRVDTAAAIAAMGRPDDHEGVREIIVTYPDRVLFGTDLVRVKAFDMPPGPEAERWNLTEFYERHWHYFETSEPALAHPLPAQGAWTVSGLNLPDEVLALIYYENARSLFRWPDAVSSPPAVPMQA